MRRMGVNEGVKYWVKRSPTRQQYFRGYENGKSAVRVHTKTNPPFPPIQCTSHHSLMNTRHASGWAHSSRWRWWTALFHSACTNGCRPLRCAQLVCCRHHLRVRSPRHTTDVRGGSLQGLLDRGCHNIRMLDTHGALAYRQVSPSLDA
jgi:hypothetical protein